MSEIVDRLLPLLLENRSLNNKGISLLQKSHQKISKKKKEDRTAEEWFVLGYYALQIQNYDDAQAHFTEAVLKNPEFEAAYKFRASVCIDVQQFEDALYDIEKALELDPLYTDAIFEKARLFHEQDENKKAVMELNKVIKNDPEYSDAYALLGSIYEKTGEYEKAVETFNKAIELDPESGHYYTQRGLAHYFANNYDPAKADLEKAQKITGTNHVSQFNLGLVLGEIDEQVKDAFRNFEKAFKRAPDMLNQFFLQVGKKEKDRLEKRLKGLVKKHSAKNEQPGGQFYREQLVQLLERKLYEAAQQAKS